MTDDTAGEDAFSAGARRQQMAHLKKVSIFADGMGPLRSKSVDVVRSPSFSHWNPMPKGKASITSKSRTLHTTNCTGQSLLIHRMCRQQVSNKDCLEGQVSRQCHGTLYAAIINVVVHMQKQHGLLDMHQQT